MLFSMMLLGNFMKSAEIFSRRRILQADSPPIAAGVAAPESPGEHAAVGVINLRSGGRRKPGRSRAKNFFFSALPRDGFFA
jgi:hypothetical protein